LYAARDVVRGGDVLDDGGGGGGVYNPYSEQTAVNTDPGPSGGGLPVDVDLDGMVAYAEQMQAASSDVFNRVPDHSELGTMPLNGWDGDVLGEAQYFRHKLQTNAAELNQYLGNLGLALLNVGMAAQTVADAYGNSDGWSAASLDTVMFAFGMPGATRPEGMHPMVGTETYWGNYYKQMRDGTAPVDPGSTDWTEQPTVYMGNMSIQTATLPNGQRRTIETRSGPDGVMTTTTVYAANGDVISRNGQLVSARYSNGSAYQTTTTYDQNGGVTGRTEERRTTNSDGDVTSESTSTYDDKGELQDTVTTNVDGDGSSTTTTTDRDGNVVDRSAVGADTEGSRGMPDSPYMEETDRIEEAYG
jgi:hypothetical protein